MVNCPRLTSAIRNIQRCDTRALAKDVPPLDIATLKDFIRYKVSVSKGNVDKEKTTVDSIKTFEEWFFAGSARITGIPYAEEDRHELYKVCFFHSVSV